MPAEKMRPLPTTPDEAAGLVDSRRHRATRRAGFILLVVVLILGATNVLGPQVASVTASGDGFELTVTYASVSRPGLSTPWTLEVRRPGGFDSPIMIATTGDYFDLFDENGLDPDPEAATTDGNLLVWEFAPPHGDVLTVTFDARIEPASHLRRSAETSVLVDREAVVSVRYSTVTMP
jgi:hypothetical protein